MEKKNLKKIFTEQLHCWLKKIKILVRFNTSLGVIRSVHIGQQSHFIGINLAGLCWGPHEPMLRDMAGGKIKHKAIP